MKVKRKSKSSEEEPLKMRGCTKEKASGPLSLSVFSYKLWLPEGRAQDAHRHWPAVGGPGISAPLRTNSINQRDVPEAPDSTHPFCLMRPRLPPCESCEWGLRSSAIRVDLLRSRADVSRAARFTFTGTTSARGAGGQVRGSAGLSHPGDSVGKGPSFPYLVIIFAFWPVYFQLFP